MSDRTCVEGPDPDGPCRACPWLVVNHQRRHADGWYTVANRRRLWGGLRAGEMMTCHPTDPSNPAPSDRPGAVAAPGTTTRLCAGAWALIAGELNAATETLRNGGSLASYGRSRPVPPLTRDGATAHAARLVPWPGEVLMPTTWTWDPALVGVGVPRTRK